MKQLPRLTETGNICLALSVLPSNAVAQGSYAPVLTPFYWGLHHEGLWLHSNQADSFSGKLVHCQPDDATPLTYAVQLTHAMPPKGT